MSLKPRAVPSGLRPVPFALRPLPFALRPLPFALRPLPSVFALAAMVVTLFGSGRVMSASEQPQTGTPSTLAQQAG